MQKIEIYIAAHKKFKNNTNELYIPIQVGKYLNEELGYLGDNTGDNISKLNPYYCEMTALYWMWKNSTADIIGLCHYRRYLVQENGFLISKKHYVTNILNNYDIILPIKSNLNVSNKEQYQYLHNEKDLQITRNIIEQLNPKYLLEFDHFMNYKSLYAFNMFISSKRIMDDYCKWVFNILKELEKRIDISNYDPYQQRIYGFISERLFNVWILHNNLKIKELPVRNLENKSYYKFLIEKCITTIFGKATLDKIINKVNSDSVVKTKDIKKK